VCLFLLAVKL